MANKPKISPMNGLSVPCLSTCESDDSTVNGGDLRNNSSVPAE